MNIWLSAVCGIDITIFVASFFVLWNCIQTSSGTIMVFLSTKVIQSFPLNPLLHLIKFFCFPDELLPNMTIFDLARSTFYHVHGIEAERYHDLVKKLGLQHFVRNKKFSKIESNLEVPKSTMFPYYYIEHVPRPDLWRKAKP